MYHDQTERVYKQKYLGMAYHSQVPEQKQVYMSLTLTLTVILREAPETKIQKIPVATSYS